jgi:Omp85 superfamily domain
MASGAPNATSPLTSNIRVSAANSGGWIITVERNGEALVTEHHTDWHRVERRVEALRSTFASLLARAAASIVIALATAAPVIAQDAPTELLPEPPLITKAVERVSRFKGDETSAAKDGFYAHTGQMITGAGWISLGPGYRRHLLGGHAVADVSTALSWRGYKTAQARVELPSLADDHVVVGSQVRWSDLTQVTYFGAGPDALEAQRSDYRLQTTDTVFYATVRRNQIVSLTGGVGWLARPAISSSTGPFDRDLPDTADLFFSEPGARRARQPRFLHGDLALAADTRDEPSHPSRGGLYRAALSGFRDLEDGAFTFDRYELEGAHFVPFWTGRMVLAVHGWGVFTSTAAGREVPFYLLPSLGGHNTLRGYTDYRFHDRNLLGVNVESRWALFRHVDAAVFADAGSVAARASDLDLSRTSYGTGVRLHSGASTIARFDVGKSDEGWHFMFRLNDPQRLSRIARRTAAIPFVP